MASTREHHLLLHIFSLVLIVLHSNSAHSQSILVSGKVVEMDSKEAIPGVHILIKSNNRAGSISDVNGRFMIEMDLKDTLIFSAIGYEDYLLNAPGGSKTDLIIPMKTKTKTLEQVEVFAFRDEYALKKAILETKPGPEEKLEIIGLKEGIASIPNQDTKMGKGWRMSGNVGPDRNIFAPKFIKSGIISNLVKNIGKKNKAKNRYEQLVVQEKQVKEKYNPETVANLTNLPEDLIQEFMKFCNLQEDFILASTEYELAVAVLACLDEFDPTMATEFDH